MRTSIQCLFLIALIPSVMAALDVANDGWGPDGEAYFTEEENESMAGVLLNHLSRTVEVAKMNTVGGAAEANVKAARVAQAAADAAFDAELAAILAEGASIVTEAESRAPLLSKLTAPELATIAEVPVVEAPLVKAGAPLVKAVALRRIAGELVSAADVATHAKEAAAPVQEEAIKEAVAEAKYDASVEEDDTPEAKSDASVEEDDTPEVDNDSNLPEIPARIPPPIPSRDLKPPVMDAMPKPGQLVEGDGLLSDGDLAAEEGAAFGAFEVDPPRQVFENTTPGSSARRAAKLMLHKAGLIFQRGGSIFQRRSSRGQILPLMTAQDNLRQLSRGQIHPFMTGNDSAEHLGAFIPVQGNQEEERVAGENFNPVDNAAADVEVPEVDSDEEDTPAFAGWSLSKQINKKLRSMESMKYRNNVNVHPLDKGPLAALNLQPRGRRQISNSPAKPGTPAMKYLRVRMRRKINSRNQRIKPKFEMNKGHWKLEEMKRKSKSRRRSQSYSSGMFNGLHLPKIANVESKAEVKDARVEEEIHLPELGRPVLKRYRSA